MKLSESPKTSPLISVIIPCYNAESTLSFCLQSLRVQEYSNFEILCVNDCSTDSTKIILEELQTKDRRIRILNNKKNIGQGYSRNLGVELAKGDYFAFVDSDDFVEPEYLSTLYELIESADADLSQVGIRYIFEDRNYSFPMIDGVIEGKATKYRIDSFDNKPFLTPQPWNKLYDRRLFFPKEGKITYKNIVYEDTEILPHLLQHVKKVVIDSKPLYNYYKQNSVITGANSIVKRFPYYLDSIRTSLLPYVTPEAIVDREILGIPFPKTITANFGNMLTSTISIWNSLSNTAQTEIYTSLIQFLQNNKDHMHILLRYWEPILYKFLKESPIKSNLEKKLLGTIKDSVYEDVSPILRDNPRKVVSFEKNLTKYDARVKKNSNTWIFTTYARYPHVLDNSRAVFEKVRNIAHIKKVIILNGDPLPGFTYEGVNIEVFQLHSIDALKSLASAGVIITTYSLHAMFGYRRLVNNSQRKIIQLWHGVPIKKIGSFIQSEKWWPYESERYHCLPASSKDDQITMARSFFNGDTTKVILSGLPRHDFLSISDDDLPTDYRRFQDLIINRCDGKRMILFAPTWRENPKDNLKFTFNQLNEIIYLMKEYDWVFAYRLHPNSLAQSTVDLFSMVSDQLIDVNDIPDSNVLLRYASGIITDYSSIYIDYMKLKRPVLLYTPDLEGYERQFNYSYEEFSPHERISTFEEFIGKLEYIVSGKYVLDEQYQKVLRRFHEYELDNLNSIRLLNQLKLLPGGDK